jgi:uncharacterized protein YlzI (FlbEa/FlbD family)
MWVRFTDENGDPVLIRASTIEAVDSCTPMTRVHTRNAAVYMTESVEHVIEKVLMASGEEHRHG